MGFFNETVAAHLEGRTVGAALLMLFDFVDEPLRYWTGFGPLEAGGYTWEGSGDVIEIDGLGAPAGVVAAQTTAALSGVPANLVAIVRNASHRVKGRSLKVYLQCLLARPEDGGMPWRTLDQPALIWSGIMDQMRYLTDGPGTRRISVSAESVWTDRNRPPFGLLTSADQKARFPGDKGLDFAPSLVNKTIRWI